MGGVAPGSPVSASNTNGAFIFKNADDTTVGKLGLANVDPTNSGNPVVNSQGEVNGLNKFLGRVAAAGPDSLPTWTNNDVGLPIDPVKTRADSITQKFNATPGTGHGHTGTAGDGPKLVYEDSLSGIQLKGFFTKGTDLTGVTGGTHTVSTELVAETPSTGDTEEGVVTNVPYNIVQIFDSNCDNILDSLGNKVYARLTNTGGLGGTWTLTFYSLQSGVETAYSFSGSNNIEWFYQKLYTETNRPVYSDQLFTTSDLLAGTIPDATQSVKGKTLLGNAAAANVASAGSIGTANGRVANADHAHQGVHSLHLDSNSNIYADARLVSGRSMKNTQSGQDISLAVDYWTMENPAQPTLVDNQSTPTLIASWPIASFAQVVVDFVNTRSGLVRAGQIRLTNDGSSNAVLNYDWDEPFGDVGITYTTDISGGNMRLLYTSTSTGTAPKMALSVVKKPFPT